MLGVFAAEFVIVKKMLDTYENARKLIKLCYFLFQNLNI